MRNFVQPGHNVTLNAPYALPGGAGALVGALFGVATTDAPSGAAVTLATTGVFDLAKTAGEAWTVGAKVYWNDDAKTVTTTATDNTLIGVALAAAPSAATVGRVRLNGAVA
ncbi:DUF2190 family protein [Pararhodospirillum oryzae]|uniref:DUF2190 family protein n=1 Tax=Pararhodospirillum oryzae TaxID=478448 RepID=A0A512H912_9PROT|nr:capsid cement protein [Pararhodospirillum oryzae]GEO81946.1 hypothetical protein ROR02_20770 [Pararhodospirillum oryzae]